MAVDGLTAEQLATGPAPGANTIGWLVWHLTRVQDHHVSELLDRPQVWVTGPWPERFGLEPDPDDTGYDHRPEQVAGVRPDGPEALVGYYDAWPPAPRSCWPGLTESDLDRVVDERWDPPVTLGVRAGQHRRRRHPARRSGRLRPRPPRPGLTFEPGRTRSVRSVGPTRSETSPDVAASALRRCVYEDIGLVPPAGRIRRLPPLRRRHPDRLAFVARAKQLGCTLEEIPSSSTCGTATGANRSSASCTNW